MANPQIFYTCQLLQVRVILYGKYRVFLDVTMCLKCVSIHDSRCKALLTSLAEKGHNITALSPDVEKSTDSITYLHLDKVYSKIYNGSALDLFAFGELSVMNSFLFLVELNRISLLGTLESKGFWQLMDYPNDFRVKFIFFRSAKF